MQGLDAGDVKREMSAFIKIKGRVEMAQVQLQC